MSVVCVKVYKDKIIFAADSICVRGYTKTTKDFSKLEEINGMIIGGVGFAEETNLLFMYAQTHKPLFASEKGLSDFIFEFYKWKSELNIGFSSQNSYIIGYEDKAFYVENMLVKEITDYQAIGAGMEYALAVLWLGHTPKEAVKVACELCCYVAEPIVCKEIEMKAQK